MLFFLTKRMYNIMKYYYAVWPDEPEESRNIIMGANSKTFDMLKRIFRKKAVAEKEDLTGSQRFFRNFGDYLYIFVGLLLAFVLLFRVVLVDGDSMNQTLVDGDRLLLISRVLYPTPKQGDIIVASKDSFRNGERIVKRVIATEGQTVDIDFEGRTVYVDGVALEEPYVFFSTLDNGGMLDEGMKFPLTVEEGCVFVMGDNRNNSRDSRDPLIGQIDQREILGKVVLLMIPGTDGGTKKADFSRIGVLS